MENTRPPLPIETIRSNPRYARRCAKLDGKTRYVSGKPCPKGHNGERHTSTGRCCECNEEWKRDNREAVLELSRRYMSDPKVKAARRIYERERNASRPDLILTGRMRARIYASVRGRTKSWRLMTPYTVQELRDHLERQFTDGMSWENIGKWEIDHIVPVKAFNIKKECDEEFNACWALSNLRPMWKPDNRKKSFTRTHLI